MALALAHARAVLIVTRCGGGGGGGGGELCGDGCAWAASPTTMGASVSDSSSDEREVHGGSMLTSGALVVGERMWSADPSAWVVLT